MRFHNWKEMYDYLQDKGDLYNEELGVFVFRYNERGALCTYDIDKDKAPILAKEAEFQGEYWETCLGPGGEILENSIYNEASYNDPTGQALELFLEPSYDFCKEFFEHSGWIDTNDYFDQVLKQEKDKDSDLSGEKSELLKLASKFNEAIKEAGKYRDAMYKILYDLDIDPYEFEEASDDQRSNWNQDFELFHAYDIEASAEFLDEKMLEGEKEF